MKHRNRQPAAARQHGAALIISLLMLAIVMVLATAGWQVGTQQERMVGQQRDHAIAFEAAEAALRDGERDLLGNCALGFAAGACNPRTQPINGETGFGDSGAPGTCSSTGLCLGVTGERPDFNSRTVIEVLTGAPGAIGLPVVFGTYTRPAGAEQTFNGPNGAPLPWQPRYVIESLCYGGGGQGMTGSFVASCPSPTYRITAIARGVRRSAGADDQASEVILQSFYSLGN
ncbi:MAG: PilX N-terminal domain-containing pilus assembly protein [Lautropia sp.]